MNSGKNLSKGEPDHVIIAAVDPADKDSAVVVLNTVCAGFVEWASGFDLAENFGFREFPESDPGFFKRVYQFTGDAVVNAEAGVNSVGFFAQEREHPEGVLFINGFVEYFITVNNNRIRRDNNPFKIMVAHRFEFMEGEFLNQAGRLFNVEVVFAVVAFNHPDFEIKLLKEFFPAGGF